MKIRHHLTSKQHPSSTNNSLLIFGGENSRVGRNAVVLQVAADRQPVLLVEQERAARPVHDLEAAQQELVRPPAPVVLDLGANKVGVVAAHDEVLRLGQVARVFDADALVHVRAPVRVDYDEAVVVEAHVHPDLVLVLEGGRGLVVADENGPVHFDDAVAARVELVHEHFAVVVRVAALRLVHRKYPELVIHAVCSRQARNRARAVLFPFVALWVVPRYRQVFHVGAPENVKALLVRADSVPLLQVFRLRASDERAPRIIAYVVAAVDAFSYGGKPVELVVQNGCAALLCVLDVGLAQRELFDFLAFR